MGYDEEIKQKCFIRVSQDEFLSFLRLRPLPWKPGPGTLIGPIPSSMRNRMWRQRSQRLSTASCHRRGCPQLPVILTRAQDTLSHQVLALALQALAVSPVGERPSLGDRRPSPRKGLQYSIAQEASLRGSRSQGWGRYGLPIGHSYIVTARPTAGGFTWAHGFRGFSTSQWGECEKGGCQPSAGPLLLP